MDIREYFRKLRQAESEITGDYAVIVSTETPDGGKAGRVVEVTKAVAAHMIVDGRGRIATASEIKSFRAEMADLIEKEKAQQNAGKVQVTILSGEQLRAIRESIIANPELLNDEDAFLKAHKR
jgi:hypothetical protein